ncbi:hypothetical protein Trydic_g22285 [Trypoxylus dichotomus]
MHDLKIYEEPARPQENANRNRGIYSQHRHDIQRKQVRHIPPRARKECHGGRTREPARWKYHTTPPTKRFIHLSQNKTEGNATSVKATLVERYKKMLRTIWMSELTAKHKSTATNMLAVPIVSHTFASIRWNVDEINQLDRDTRKNCTANISNWCPSRDCRRN